MTSKHAWRRSPPLTEHYYEVLSSMIRTEQYYQVEAPCWQNSIQTAYSQQWQTFSSAPLFLWSFEFTAVHCPHQYLLFHTVWVILAEPLLIYQQRQAQIFSQWQWKTIMLGDNLNNSWRLRKLRTRCLKVSLRKTALPPKCSFFKDLSTWYFKYGANMSLFKVANDQICKKNSHLCWAADTPRA